MTPDILGVKIGGASGSIPDVPTHDGEQAGVMTENPDPAPGATFAPPPPSYAPRVLRRTRDDRVIGGVAAGFGRWLGVDPVVVRVVLVVLAIFGGSGLLLYAAGWLFIPEEGAPANEAQRFIESTGKPGSTGRIAFIVVAGGLGIIVLSAVFGGGPWHGFWFFGGGGSVLLLAATGALVLWLLNKDKTPQAASVAAMSTTVVAPTPEATGYSYGGYGDYPGYVPPTPTPVPPPTPKPRSYLGAATLSVALVAVGALVTLNVTGAADIPAVVVLATGLGVLGIGMLVGTVFGRARWLLAIAIPLLFCTMIASIIPSDLRLGTEIGDRTWRPITISSTSDEFRLDIGQAQVDLTKLVIPAGTTSVPISASVGVGELAVIVPEGVRVIVDASVGGGRIWIQGLPEVSGTTASMNDEVPGVVPPNAPTITLTAEVGLGNLEVYRAQASN